MLLAGIAVRDWYGVTVERSGDNFDYTTDMIMESDSSNPAMLVFTQRRRHGRGW